MPLAILRMLIGMLGWTAASKAASGLGSKLFGGTAASAAKKFGASKAGEAVTSALGKTAAASPKWLGSRMPTESGDLLGKVLGGAGGLATFGAGFAGFGAAESLLGGEGPTMQPSEDEILAANFSRQMQHDDVVTAVTEDAEMKRALAAVLGVDNPDDIAALLAQASRPRIM